jgi:hypothetical protein
MVKRTERGWGGHFCAAHCCLFRRNTLLERNDVRVVVSTVGAMKTDMRKRTIEEIGYNRYYETMAFYTLEEDIRYRDADVSRQINFSSPWCINIKDADDKANEMHEAIVNEITEMLERGEINNHISNAESDRDH